MKKNLNFNFIIVFSFLLLAGFVIADEPGLGDVTAVSNSVESGTNKVISFIGNILSPIFGVLLGDAKGPEFIIKILAFLMITIIVYGVGDTMKILGGDKKWLNFLLGAIVAIIGVRFMPDNLLTALTAPSSALVAIIFFGIPFVAFFFVVEKIRNNYVRRLASVMYAFLMFIAIVWNGVWSTDPTIQAAFNKYWWIYLFFAIAAFLIAFFDGTLQKIFGSIGRDEYKARISNREENLKLSQITKLQEALSNANGKDIVEIRKQIKHAQEQLKAIQESANY